jgi:hypothetical protein
LIIIYNVSGLLIGAAGFLVGVFGLVLTRSFALGLVFASVTWCALGFWWRRKPTADGTVRAYPSIFFIPVPWIAIVTLLAGLALTPVEFMARSKRENDPRGQMLESVERSVRAAAVSGEKEVATLVRDAVLQGNFAGVMADSASVHVAANETGALAVIKITNLKRFTPEARMKLLDTVATTLSAHERCAGKQQYIGIKGPLMFGAIRTPAGTTSNSSAGDELRAYFGDEASTPVPAAPATASADAVTK